MDQQTSFPHRREGALRHSRLASHLFDGSPPLLAMGNVKLPQGIIFILVEMFFTSVIIWVF